MDDFDTLRDLLRNDVLAPVVRREGYNKSVTLVERDDQHYTLDVTSVPDDVVAFKTDRFPPPKRIFKDSKWECKRADYVIIARTETESWIIYVEMKADLATLPRSNVSYVVRSA